MVIVAFREFLESSTIHGLVHISTAKSWTIRATWIVIVGACFASAIWMITDSYQDWHKSPVSTTITTHPINELEFPAVTVCPPRETNTVLNHLLRKVRNVNFTEKERQDLMDISKEVFFKSYGIRMTQLLSNENIRSISNGQTSVSMSIKSQINLKSTEPEGSFKMPGFRDSDYQGDFYSKEHSLYFVLDKGEIEQTIADDSALVISVETDGNWSYMLGNDSSRYGIHYICATKKQAKTGNCNFVLKKDLLCSHNIFRFWWKHKPDYHSRNLKGFQITWKIENRSLSDLREFVSRDISGSVATPGFGTIAPPDFFEETHVYTAVIELPHNFSDLMEDSLFVVDVNITSFDTDVELVTTSLKYEWNHNEMNWTAANFFCQSKGGHLASVSTHYDWQRLQEFYAEVLPEGKDYDDYLYVWLGGKQRGNGKGKWVWTDRSVWSEEHWMDGEPVRDQGKDFLQLVASTSTGSEWIAYFKNDTAQSICQVPIKMKIRESTELVFSSKNISTLQFTCVQDATIQSSIQNNGSYIGGFKLTWRLDGLKDLDLKSGEKEAIAWKFKETDLESRKKGLEGIDGKNMRGVLSLVREARKHKVSEMEVWNSVLRNRWNIHILNQESPCPSGVDIQKMIINVAHELNLTIWHSGWIPETDLGLGARLFSVITYCPSHVVESAKLSIFFESLLTNHSLETIVTATMNILKPRAGDTIEDFNAINTWYERLDQKYNLSVGPLLTALSTNEQLAQLKRLNAPFLKNSPTSSVLTDQERIYDIKHFIGKSK